MKKNIPQNRNLFYLDFQEPLIAPKGRICDSSERDPLTWGEDAGYGRK